MQIKFPFFLFQNLAILKALWVQVSRLRPSNGTAAYLGEPVWMATQQSFESPLVSRLSFNISCLSNLSHFEFLGSKVNTDIYLIKFYLNLVILLYFLLVCWGNYWWSNSTFGEISALRWWSCFFPIYRQAFPQGKNSIHAFYSLSFKLDQFLAIYLFFKLKNMVTMI